jgi:invasion protein IalB
MQIKLVLSAAIGGLVLMSVQFAHAQQPSVTTETYGNWTYRCTLIANPAEQEAAPAVPTTAENPAKTEAASTMVCETSQILQDAKGNVIAQIAFGLDPATTDKLIVAFQVPQGTLLSSPVRFGTEGLEDSLEAEYVTCYQSICLARAETEKTIIKTFGESKNGMLEFADRSGRKINVLLSFDGMTAANERLTSGK